MPPLKDSMRRYELVDALLVSIRSPTVVGCSGQTLKTKSSGFSCLAAKTSEVQHCKEAFPVFGLLDIGFF